MIDNALLGICERILLTAERLVELGKRAESLLVLGFVTDEKAVVILLDEMPAFQGPS